MGTLPQLFAGGVAGDFAKTCTALVACLAILFQVQEMHSEITALTRPSILREAVHIVNEEGVRAFWKENMVTVVHRLPYSAVKFYAYERCKQINAGFDTHNESKANDALVHITCGGMEGIIIASAFYPWILLVLVLWRRSLDVKKNVEATTIDNFQPQLKRSLSQTKPTFQQ